MEIFTKSAEDTQKFGQEFSLKLKGGEVLGLVGNLGSGKTTFTQGLAQGLGINNRIISPTFILQRHYEVTSTETPISNLYHIDLYRLENNIEHELKNLGVEDFWEKRENIVVIEWADKACDLLPENTIWIEFSGSANDQRQITIKRKERSEQRGNLSVLSE